MAITLDTLTLPDDLIWVDEYAFTPVKQTVSVAIDGSLIIEAAAQTKGRPITLQGNEDAAWIDRGTLEQLRAKQYQPALAMTLVMNGVTFSVLFKQPGGIDAKPLIDYSTPEDADWYQITLFLMEI